MPKGLQKGALWQRILRFWFEIATTYEGNGELDSAGKGTCVCPPPSRSRPVTRSGTTRNRKEPTMICQRDWRKSQYPRFGSAGI